MKNTLGGINRLHKAEEQISDLEDKVAEERKKESPQMRIF